MTASRVATDGAAAVAELAAPLVHHLAVGAHDVGGHRADVQRLLHTFEQRTELVSVHAPRIEHEVWRSETGARVDERRATDTAPDRQGDGGHADGESEAVAAVETPQALGRWAGEIPAVEMLAFFEDDDLQASFGQLLGCDRATGPAADDDHVDRFVETAVRLLHRQLDQTRVELHLLERLPVVADERLDAIVGAEEHQDQRFERDQGFTALADLRGLAGDEISLTRRRAQHSEGAQVSARDRR